MAALSAFATVGTTQFDKFIQKLTTNEVLKVLREKGYTKLTIQIGNGSYEPPTGFINGVEISHYRFKNSISEDMRSADLILSHAGAGSCLEALEAGKALLVVVNEELMDNHQTELAQQLNSQQLLYYCNCETLIQTLQTSNFSDLNSYVKGDSKKFAQYLDQIMNFV